MAFSAEVASDVNDILVRAKVFFETQGWTTNGWEDDSYNLAGDAFTGKFLSISKTLNGVALHAHLRSALANRVTNSSNTTARLRGVALAVGTGYDADADYWWNQPGANASFCPLAGTDTSSSILVHFYAGDYCGAIGLSSTWGFRFIVFGVLTSGLPFYLGSHCYNLTVATWNKSFVYFLEDAGASTAAWGRNIGVRYPSDWAGGGSKATDSSLAVAAGAGQFNFGCFLSEGDQHRTPTKSFLLNTDSSSAHGPILLPSLMFTKLTDEAFIRSIGHCPEMAFLNMVGVTSGDEITVGSDDWGVYLNDEYRWVHDAVNPFGLALKK